MRRVVLVLSPVFALGGFAAIAVGQETILNERGATLVIAGTMALATSAVLLALAAVAGEVAKLTDVLEGGFAAQGRSRLRQRLERPRDAAPSFEPDDGGAAPPAPGRIGDVPSPIASPIGLAASATPAAAIVAAPSIPAPTLAAQPAVSEARAPEAAPTRADIAAFKARDASIVEPVRPLVRPLVTPPTPLPDASPSAIGERGSSLEAEKPAASFLRRSVARDPLTPEVKPTAAEGGAKPAPGLPSALETAKAAEPPAPLSQPLEAPSAPAATTAAGSLPAATPSAEPGAKPDEGAPAPAPWWERMERELLDVSDTPSRTDPASKAPPVPPTSPPPPTPPAQPTSSAPDAPPPARREPLAAKSLGARLGGLRPTGEPAPSADKVPPSGGTGDSAMTAASTAASGPLLRPPWARRRVPGFDPPEDGSDRPSESDAADSAAPVDAEPGAPTPQPASGEPAPAEPVLTARRAPMEGPGGTLPRSGSVSADGDSTSGGDAKPGIDLASFEAMLTDELVPASNVPPARADAAGAPPSAPARPAPPQPATTVNRESAPPPPPAASNAAELASPAAEDAAGAGARGDRSPWWSRSRFAPAPPPAEAGRDEAAGEADEASDATDATDATDAADATRANEPDADAPAVEPDEVDTPPENAVIGSYSADGATYTMYADGSVKMDDASGTRRFDTLDALRAYLAEGA